MEPGTPSPKATPSADGADHGVGAASRTAAAPTAQPLDCPHLFLLDGALANNKAAIEGILSARQKGGAGGDGDGEAPLSGGEGDAGDTPASVRRGPLLGVRAVCDVCGAVHYHWGSPRGDSGQVLDHLYPECCETTTGRSGSLGWLIKESLRALAQFVEELGIGIRPVSTRMTASGGGGPAQESEAPNAIRSPYLAHMSIIKKRLMSTLWLGSPTAERPDSHRKDLRRVPSLEQLYLSTDVKTPMFFDVHRDLDDDAIRNIIMSMSSSNEGNSNQKSTLRWVQDKLLVRAQGWLTDYSGKMLEGLSEKSSGDSVNNKGESQSAAHVKKSSTDDGGVGGSASQGDAFRTAPLPLRHTPVGKARRFLFYLMLPRRRQLLMAALKRRLLMIGLSRSSFFAGGAYRRDKDCMDNSDGTQRAATNCGAGTAEHIAEASLASDVYRNPVQHPSYQQGFFRAALAGRRGAAAAFGAPYEHSCYQTINNIMVIRGKKELFYASHECQCAAVRRMLWSCPDGAKGCPVGLGSEQASAVELGVCHWTHEPWQPSFIHYIDHAAKQIVVAFRGTVSNSDFVVDLHNQPLYWLWEEDLERYRSMYSNGHGHEPSSGSSGSPSEVACPHINITPSADRPYVGGRCSLDPYYGRPRHYYMGLNTSKGVAASEPYYYDGDMEGVLAAPFGFFFPVRPGSPALTQLEQRLYKDLERYPTYQLLLTGHSLGAAYAAIFAASRLRRRGLLSPDIMLDTHRFDEHRYTPEKEMAPAGRLSPSLQLFAPPPPLSRTWNRDLVSSLGGRDHGGTSGPITFAGADPVTTYVHALDIVPRLQVSAFVRLLNVLVAQGGRSSDSTVPLQGAAEWLEDLQNSKKPPAELAELILLNEGEAYQPSTATGPSLMPIYAHGSDAASRSSPQHFVLPGVVHLLQEMQFESSRDGERKGGNETAKKQRVAITPISADDPLLVLPLTSRLGFSHHLLCHYSRLLSILAGLK